jgi:membrane associated rhomboid family serine protease
MTTSEQTMECYRHPKTETAVSCASCGRPICTECMVFAAVGIKCPECAGQPIGIKKATKRARSATGISTGGLVTKVLIAVNLAVFLLQISQGDVRYGVDSAVYEHGSLVGGEVANGEWWRLVTSGFLHIGFIHILFNMLMLWWFGSALEEFLGRGRYLALYFISMLAGAAGALLLTGPFDSTAGASGAVYGILGAGIVLERRGINIFGGIALMIVAFNLVMTVTLNNVSLGGHLGGLIGGMLAIFVMTRFGQAHAAYARLGASGIVGLVGIALASVVISYVRVRGYA